MRSLIVQMSKYKVRQTKNHFGHSMGQIQKTDDTFSLRFWMDRWAISIRWHHSDPHAEKLSNSHLMQQGKYSNIAPMHVVCLCMSTFLNVTVILLVTQGATVSNHIVLFMFSISFWNSSRNSIFSSKIMCDPFCVHFSMPRW